MNLKEVDLHIHTTCSDGQYTVDEVLQKAKDAGLRFIGIVDHDTIEHFKVLSESKFAVKMLAEGYRIFAGIEFDCKAGNKKMHLIGYNINYKSEEIIELIKYVESLREKKFQHKIQHLKNLGIELKDEQIKYLCSIKNVGKPHIARCLIENGYGTTVKEVVDKYLQTQDVLDCNINAEDVIELVHAVGGYVVIAHPYQILKDNKLTEAETEEVWNELVALKADGMECYYSKYNAEQIQKLVEYATDNNLMITMGSDFHGEIPKPDVKIGQIIKNG